MSRNILRPIDRSLYIDIVQVLDAMRCFYQLKDDICVRRENDGCAIAFDPGSGAFVGLNSSATVLCDTLRKQATDIESLVDRLFDSPDCSLGSADRSRVASDVEIFLATIDKLGLLETVTPGKPFNLG